MDLVGDIGHSIRELGKVRPDRSVVISPIGPAVVENNIFVAGVLEAIGGHALCGAENEVLTDTAGIGVPIVLMKKVSKCTLNPDESLESSPIPSAV